MKATATIRSKGRITIPQGVRRLLGLQTGDVVEFEIGNGRVEIRTARPKRTSAGILKRYLRKGWKPPGVEQMDSGIADTMTRKHRAWEVDR